MKKVLQWIGGIVVALVVLGMFVDTPDPSSNFSTNSTANGSGSSADYDITDLTVKRGEYGNEVITGILKNNSGQDVSYVQVEINLYDASGIQTGTTMANTNNLDAGARWRFEAMPLNDFSDFEVKGVTGF